MSNAEALELRIPANQVSPRAVSYWRLGACVFPTLLLIGGISTLVLAPPAPWWTVAIGGTFIALLYIRAWLMPIIRFRVHRWEVTATAVHTQSGWLSRSTRIAPLSRVQTVDSHQGALMRPFRLASLVVTTASAVGPVSIVGLDEEVANRLVAELVAITSASTGDAT